MNHHHPVGKTIHCIIDWPKRCFTVLPEPNKLTKVLFAKLHRTELKTLKTRKKPTTWRYQMYASLVAGVLLILHVLGYFVKTLMITLFKQAKLKISQVAILKNAMYSKEKSSVFCRKMFCHLGRTAQEKFGRTVLPNSSAEPNVRSVTSLLAL